MVQEGIGDKGTGTYEFLHEKVFDPILNSKDAPGKYYKWRKYE